jgi:1,2-diacylglycerol 3-alpha-glucosyltransferase
MKILISTDQYIFTSGVTTSINCLTSELLRRGHDVRILTLSDSNKSFYKDNIYYIGSFPIHFGTKDRYSFKKNDKLIEEIIEWNPDIIHVQTEFSTYQIARKIAKKVKCPIINTCHAIHEHYISYFFPSKILGKFFLKRILRRVYNEGEALIIPTLKVKSYMDEYHVKTKTVIIPTGIDLDNFKNIITDNEREKLLQELNIDANSKILVTVSRLAKEKNIDELLDNFKKLLDYDKSFILLIVGDGNYRNHLERKVKRLNIQNNVIFTGMISNNLVYKYYQLGKVFVCASESESQGLTYIEALANYLPIVCKKDKCLEDVLIEGKNGYTFTDKTGFVSSIIKIFNSRELYDFMKKNAYEKSLDFSKQVFASKILELYNDVIFQ